MKKKKTPQYEQLRLRGSSTTRNLFLNKPEFSYIGDTHFWSFGMKYTVCKGSEGRHMQIDRFVTTLCRYLVVKTNR